MEEKTRLIKPEWYGTLDFLGGRINNEKALELVKEISKSYFLAKEKGLLPTPTGLTKEDEFGGNRLSADDESCYIRVSSKCKHLDNPFLKELNLAYKIANESDLPMAELTLMSNEGNFFASFNTAWAALDGKVQAYIFRSLTPERKEWFVNKFMHQGLSWCEDEYYYEVNESFKLDSDGVKSVIKYLIGCWEHYLPHDECPTLYESFLLPIELVEYMEDNEEIRNLWLEYLNSNSLNRVYAGEVLALLEDVRALEPLMKLLKLPIQDPFEKPHPLQDSLKKPQLQLVSYETQCKRSIMTSIELIGEPALPLLEAIVANPLENAKDIAKIVIKFIQRGDDPAKSLGAAGLLRRMLADGIKASYRCEREWLKSNV